MSHMQTDELAVKQGGRDRASAVEAIFRRKLPNGEFVQTEAISSAVSALNSPGSNIGSSVIDPMLSRCSPTTLFWKCPNIRFTW